MVATADDYRAMAAKYRRDRDALIEKQAALERQGERVRAARLPRYITACEQMAAKHDRLAAEQERAQ